MSRKLTLLLLLISLLAFTGTYAQVSSNTCAALGAANTYPVSGSCVPIILTKPASYTATYTAVGCDGGNYDDTWARFVATTANTAVRITTTSGDATLHIYTGACGSLVPVGCVNDNTGGASGEAEAIELATTIGQTYIIRVQRVGSNNSMHSMLCIVGYTLPANDLCSAAPLIGSGTTAFSSYGATGTDITSCTNNDTRDIWFNYVPECTGIAEVSTCGTVDFNSALAVFSACGGAQLACNAASGASGCTNGQAKMAFPVVAGTSYLLRVSGDNGAVGAGTLTIGCLVTSDLCADASPISNGATAFRTTAATGTDIIPCGVNDYKDIWMNYTASCGGEVVMTTCGASFNTTLAAFTACGGSMIVCNNDDPACGTASTIKFPALPGEQFLIRIAGVAASAGTGTLQVDCNPINWYSQASGSTSDPIWSRTPSGTPGAAVFSNYTSIVVQADHNIIQDVPSIVTRRLVVVSSGSYDVGSNTLDLLADLEVEGSLNASNGDVRMVGDVKQLITGTDLLTIRNMALDNPAGLDLMAALNITGTLSLVQGEFATNEHTVRLVSNASGTARLGPVGASASMNGNLFVERYIPAGTTNWRLLSSPVQNRNLNNWQDDFITAGFPGAHYPNFMNGGQLWPSIRTYKESMPGSVAVGMVGPVNVNDPLTPGRGFQAWSGSTLTTTTAFVVDVNGAPVVAHTPFTLPVTWTNTGNVEGDGWNLVGNPVASPIDFTTMSKGADVRNMYWIFNPVSGSMDFWNETLQAGSAGMNGNIQSSQAFWLKVDGPANAVSVTEANKVNDPTGGLFGGITGADSRALAAQPLVRVRITDLNNGYYSEALVHFGAGNPGTDDQDMGLLHFDLGGEVAPIIASIDPNGRELALNAYGNNGADVFIPMMVKSAASGMHRIEIMESGNTGLPDCLILQDLLTGEFVQVSAGNSMEILLTVNDIDNGPRFRLVGASPLAFASVNATCADLADGTAAVQGDDNWSYAWQNAAGAVIGTDMSVNGLAAGTYTLTVNGDEACANRTHTFTIAAPSPIVALPTITSADCVTNMGGISLALTGGTAPYTAYWSTGATTIDLPNVAAGTYAVAIMDAANCSRQFNGIVVNPTNELNGELTVATDVVVNVPVEFSSTANGNIPHTWSFGDGASSAATTPTHAYTDAGTYTVSLTLGNGNCTRVLTTTVNAGLATGVDELANTAVEAYSAGNSFVLRNNPAETLTIWLHDRSGRTIDGPIKLAAGSPRWERNTDDLLPGTYFLQAYGNGRHWTFQLPVIR